MKQQTKKMKTTMKQHSFTSQLKSLALVFGIALTFASCANEDVAQNPTNPNEDNDKNLTTFVAGDEAKTRTSLNYNSSDFYWEAGDYIYVKDDDGVLQKSSNAPTQKVASFKYRVPGKFSAHTSYKVYYLGKNSGGNSVTISTNQSQTAPDNTAHFGTAGDYGTATANKVTGKQQFEFVLEHQVAYLVFQPYASNQILQNCYLTKIEVTSNNDIAETYTVNPTTGALDASAVTDGDKIVLTTSGSSSNPDGFPLKTNSASIATNGAYMVIKPGTHTLKVRYWVKDVATGTEGTITKAFKSFSYDENTYYDIDGNLNIREYDGDHFYAWDAQEQYWKGYEWTKNLPAGIGQPTLKYGSPGFTISMNYPKNGDSRYYHKGGSPGVRFDATQSCVDLPNANEMSWYVMYGDSHWDNDELWVTMGHLHKGGTWLKKKSVLQAEHHYDTEKSADGSTDMRITVKSYSKPNSSVALSAADAYNYFYLPAFGYYPDARWINVGSGGEYWSSSCVGISPYGLIFFASFISVNGMGPSGGKRAQKFSDFGDN